MATGGRLYGDADSHTRKAIMALEAHLQRALIDGPGADGGVIVSAMVNVLCDMLDACPKSARDFYVEQVMLTIAHNYGTVVELDGQPPPQGKPS